MAPLHQIQDFWIKSGLAVTVAEVDFGCEVDFETKVSRKIKVNCQLYYICIISTDTLYAIASSLCHFFWHHILYLCKDVRCAPSLITFFSVVSSFVMFLIPLQLSEHSSYFVKIWIGYFMIESSLASLKNLIFHP